MKIAILISGQPRFNREFNDLLDNLTGYNQLDFFFHLWNSDPGEIHWIPPTWPKDHDEIRSRIEKNLPDNSHIANLVILPQIDYKVTRKYNLTPWSNPVNIWYTYYGIREVNTLREQYESTHGEYDLVIKARPDTGLASKLDCRSIRDYLKDHPNHVVMPNDRRFGMAGVAVNDLIGIGLGFTMSTYCRAVDYFDHYNDQGCPYHGETLLAWHLTRNGIVAPPTDFNCTFREHWYAHNRPDYGLWV